MEITLEQLYSRIESLESQLSELALNNETDHGLIIDQIDQQNIAGATKGDVNDINDSIKTINNDVDSIKTKLSGITSNTVLINQIQDELKSISDNLSSSDLQAINNRLTYLEEIVKNVAKVYITKTDHNVSLKEVDVKLGAKVSYEDLDEYNERLTELEEKSRMVLVADEVVKIKNSLDVINNSITNINNGLYNTNLDVTGLSTSLTTISNSIIYDVEQVNKRCTSIESDIREGQEKSNSLTKKLADVNCAINNIKLKCSSLLTAINSLEAEINTKVEQAVDKIEDKIESTRKSISDETKNLLIDHNRYNQGHFREFSEIRSRLDGIDGRNGELSSIKKSLEKKWIEILTPEEYKLRPSSSIKQDQLYMLIKWGKPYALYIGSVLIAQRNTAKESGFIYSFPLSF